MEMNTLEAGVLEKLFAGDHPVLAALRAQLEHLRLEQRELTGAGFYAQFAVDGDAQPAPLRLGRLLFGDVEAVVDGLSHGAGFVVYVEDGLITMLEGYSYEEPWPERIESFSLSYTEPSRKKVFAELDEAMAS